MNAKKVPENFVFALFCPIVKKFKESGVVTNIERPVHHRFALSAKYIAEKIS